MGRMTPTMTIPIIRMITTTNQLHQTQRRGLALFTWGLKSANPYYADSVLLYIRYRRRRWRKFQLTKTTKQLLFEVIKCSHCHISFLYTQLPHFWSSCSKSEQLKGGRGRRERVKGGRCRDVCMRNAPISPPCICTWYKLMLGEKYIHSSFCLARAHMSFLP